jgi:preprotein translocase subunit SecB
LTRGRRAAAAPELYALAFARLAQLRGDDVTREREFAAARAAAPNAAAAIARLQAQAQLAAGDLTGARATLSSVADDDSPQVLELRAQLARRSGEQNFEVDLHIAIEAKQGDNAVFVTELVYAALFALENIPAENLQPVLLIECPRLIFPFARRIIADATRDGGFPPLMLDPIDFAQLYQQQIAAAQAQAAEANQPN